MNMSKWTVHVHVRHCKNIFHREFFKGVSKNCFYLQFNVINECIFLLQP